MSREAHRVGVDIERAVVIITSGGLIGLPTETVYGLAARADDPLAVSKVFEVKGRPRGHPLIIHVSSLDRARLLSDQWNERAEALGARFWPGPLTLVVRRASAVIDEVTGGLDTVAIRVPSHPLARQLLERLDVGLVAPSANLFGRVSPTTAEHVLDDLGGSVDYVLDGGPCLVGVESTIVDCSTDDVEILRPGAVTEADIVSVVGSTSPASGRTRAPGMLRSHYAPNCAIVTVEAESEAVSFRERGVLVIDAHSDPESFARDLYSILRRCDEESRDMVVIVLPSADGIGGAVRDRLMKAAAPRP